MIDVVVRCDCCKAIIRGLGVVKPPGQELRDLSETVTFSVEKTLMPLERKKLTLCGDCKNKLVYFMNNDKALGRAVDSMRLGNRLRFLFGKPLVIYDKEDEDGPQNEDFMV